MEVVYPDNLIEWNSFDTQICLGEYHRDSCSKTGQIIKVDYAKIGLYAGVPLLAVILTIILVCVCLRKRKREKKFKAWNKRFENHIIYPLRTMVRPLSTILIFLYSHFKHALSVNETRQNELKELMGVQKPAKEKFDEYCLMLEHQYDPKTETKKFNANKKLVQSIKGMYIDYDDVEKSNLELGSGAFGVAYKGKVSPTHLNRPRL